MKEIIFYANKRVEELDDLIDQISICYDPPEDRCVCQNCYRIKITIDNFKITEGKP